MSAQGKLGVTVRRLRRPDHFSTSFLSPVVHSVTSLFSSGANTALPYSGAVQRAWKPLMFGGIWGKKESFAQERVEDSLLAQGLS